MKYLLSININQNLAMLMKYLLIINQYQHMFTEYLWIINQALRFICIFKNYYPEFYLYKLLVKASESILCISILF